MDTPPDPTSRRTEARQHLDQLMAAGLITKRRYEQQITHLQYRGGTGPRNRSVLRGKAINAHRRYLRQQITLAERNETLEDIRAVAAEERHSPIVEAEESYVPTMPPAP